MRHTTVHSCVLWGRSWQIRRLRFSLCSVLLLITALGLYFTYAGVLFTPKIATSDATQGQKIAADPQAASTSEESYIERNITKNDDSFALNPELHIFRKPRVISLNWNITLEERAPDGVKKNIYLINGQFPGPTIEARSGDELIVNVHNSISNGQDDISVHWHGLLMKGANNMDGVVGLTQCGISPSQNFTYRFQIDDDQAGTFWYHSHSGVQRADGFYGGLVIHKPASQTNLATDMSKHQYDAEKLLLIGDWYHSQAKTLLDDFTRSNGLGLEPVPDSFLVNGGGAYNCSLAGKARPVDCTYVNLPTLTFPNSNRLRLRVVNTGVTSGIIISFPKGGMQLIAVDGGHAVHDQTPTAAAIGVLYPGERMDIIVDRTIYNTETNDSQGKSDGSGIEMMIALDNENMKLWNPGLTHIRSFPIRWKGSESKGTAMRTQNDVVPKFLLSETRGPQLEAMPGLETPAEKFVLYTSMSLSSEAGNRAVGTVNHTSWIVGDSKSSPLLSIAPENWAKVIKQPTRIQQLPVISLKSSGKNRWIELVVNNSDDKGHPFHLHGYSFYVVATRASQFHGHNPFNPSDAKALGSVNTINPLQKDTVYIPARGFAVLRFALDNDGLWLFHCHILWHQAVGMGTVLQVGTVPPEQSSEASALCTT